ncbi:MAG: DNA polymerase I [Treponema sp.]|nr:DNA polymerase I [Treponema sp.]
MNNTTLDSETTKSTNNKTVYILDSYGLIYRCYFAFISRPLTNSKGENVSALFGFFRNLHWILQHYKPNYLFAAMDSTTKTFRHEKYPEYKATRNKTPDDLHAQIPWICDILKALGVPVLQCDGYEADDIIATVAELCEKEGRPCKILSGDKDLMQLVTENTQILKPEPGANTWKITGIDGVKAEWGVEPSQLLDLLSLYGDSADNIPGVKGIGVKTASKLLTDYQDLDGIYAHIDELKGAVQKKLIEGKDSAYMSQDLVRLFNQVPCPEIKESIAAEPYTFNYKAAADLLSSFGTPSVAKSYAELSLAGGAPAPDSSLVNQSSVTPSSGDTPQRPAAPSESGSSLTDNNDQPDFSVAVQNDTSQYKALTSASELESYIEAFNNSASESQKNIIAYDCETDSLDTFNTKLIGFSLCYQEHKAVYIPIQQENEDLFNQTNYIEIKTALIQLLKLFTNENNTVIMHNAKFDIKVFINQLKNYPELTQDFTGKNSPSPVFKCKIMDTMILAWLYNSERTGKNSYSLEGLSETMLGLKGIEFSQIVQKNQTFAQVPLETAYQYAAEDADFTLQLYKKLMEKTSQKVSENLVQMEMSVLPILTQMELNGIHLDSAKLNEYNKELTEGIIKAEEEIYKEVGHQFNIASPKQLQTVLFEERKLKPGKKTKTGYSTDTSVLEELALVDSVPKMILEYRELAKLQSTYVETLPKLTDRRGRIHTDFVQTGTATGRLSCREPNLQNIPVRSEAGRRIRSAFTAPEGKILISADYSQIELVVLAHLSGDEKMSQAFINGTDIHKATASMIFGVPAEAVTPEMRRTAKTINFGVIYGMSAFRLAQDLGISRTQASIFIENYFRTYASINNFITETIQFAETNGFVQTISGRRRPIININSKNKVEKAAAERIAINTPVQGSAADIVKQAMIEVSSALSESRLPVKMLLQVHDELIFECQDSPEIVEQAINLIRDKMENAVKLKVPLKVSIEHGKSWGEFH